MCSRLVSYSLRMTLKNRNQFVYSIRIERELYDRVVVVSEKEQLTAAQFIRRAMQRELEAAESVFHKSLQRVIGTKG